MPDSNATDPGAPASPLPPPLAEFVDRCDNAIATLLEMASENDGNGGPARSDHLRSKAQGVALALSYFREVR